MKFPTSVATLRASLCAAMFVSLGSQLGAQDLVFQIQPSPSQLNLALDVGLPAPGSLIGDYDAQSNPSGTRTLLGFVGGGPNDAIPLDLTIQNSVSIANSPVGGFALSIDTTLATLEMSALEFQLGGGGQAGSADIVLDLLYDSFRTAAPDSLFIGGIPFSLPLGSAVVQTATFEQLGIGGGVLIPLGGGSWDFSVLALGELSFDVDLAGTLTVVGPIPLALPLVGTLELGGGAAMLSMQAQFLSAGTVPATGLVITDQPLAMPTILPPGLIANLLYSGVVTSIDYDLDFDLGVFASEVPSCDASSFCTAFPNSTGSGALMGTNGLHSVSQNQLELSAQPVPDEPGLFFYSSSQAQGGAGVPFGNGLRCVGSPGVLVFRLPVGLASAGRLAHSVDLSAPPSPPGVIQAGSTWNFQAWYRDPLPKFGASSLITQGPDFFYSQLLH